MPEAVEQPQAQQEIPHYSPDHLLTVQETGKEADRLIGQFVEVFKDDPDAQKAAAESFFDYSKGGYGGISFQKGNIEYGINTSSGHEIGEYGNRMMVQRKEGGDQELLWLSGEYNFFSDYKGTRLDYRHITEKKGLVTAVENNGIAVDAARTLLEKVKKDFKKS